MEQQTDSPTETDVTIVGESDQTTSQHGLEGCESSLEVRIGDETANIPWENVRPAAYDYRGDMPDEFDVNRVVLVDGHVHAEADVDGGVVELVPNYNTATGEFRGYDLWEAKFFADPVPTSYEIIHERGDK